MRRYRVLRLLGPVLLTAVLCEAQVEYRTESVPLCRADDGDCPQGAGLLRFAGGLQLTSEDGTLGGLSAIRVAASGSSGPIFAAGTDVGDSLRFVAVSDDGVLVTGQLVHDSNGWLSGVDAIRTARLRNVDGTPLEGMDTATGLDLTDAESLAATSDTDPMGGDLLIGFERLHRVLRYPVGEQGIGAVPVEQLGMGAHNGRISQCKENGGVEAMDFLASGALLVFCEEPLPARPQIDGMLVAPGWLLPQPSSSGNAHRVYLELFSEERPVAIARIPRWHEDSGDSVGEEESGGMLVLERSWNQERGNVLRLLYVDAAALSSAVAAAGAQEVEKPLAVVETKSKSKSVRKSDRLSAYYVTDDSDQRLRRGRRAEGCVIRGSQVAELNRTSHNVDNFEGLAIVALPNDRLRVYIIADDNFNPSQRTLLHSFILNVVDLTKLPRPQCNYFEDVLSGDDDAPSRQGPARWLVVVGLILLLAVLCALVGCAVCVVRAKRRQRYLETQTLPTEEL